MAFGWGVGGRRIPRGGGLPDQRTNAGHASLRAFWCRDVAAPFDRATLPSSVMCFCPLACAISGAQGWGEGRVRAMGGPGTMAFCGAPSSVSGREDYSVKVAKRLFSEFVVHRVPAIKRASAIWLLCLTQLCGVCPHSASRCFVRSLRLRGVLSAPVLC